MQEHLRATELARKTVEAEGVVREAEAKAERRKLLAAADAEADAAAQTTLRKAEAEAAALAQRTAADAARYEAELVRSRCELQCDSVAHGFCAAVIQVAARHHR